MIEQYSLRLFLLGVVAMLLIGCQDQVVVKPAGFLRLDFPQPNYSLYDSDCPYEFEANQVAKLKFKERCALNLEYPFMKATVYLTYQEVQSNLSQLLSDAQ